MPEREIAYEITPFVAAPSHSKHSGRQFVVIPASGHFLMKSGQADYLVAYALPRS
jgi:glucose dehydrogenase